MNSNKVAVLGFFSVGVLLLFIIVIVQDEGKVMEQISRASQRQVKKQGEETDKKIVESPEKFGNIISATEVKKFKKGKEFIPTNDPVLIEYIRKQMVGPSKEPLTLLQSQELDQSQEGQSKRVDEILHHKTGGFYVECGAATGERNSNSLFFDGVRNWTGLLIEADPKSYDAMLMRNRHAYSINSCLSPDNQTKAMSFEVAGERGGLESEQRAGPGGKGAANSAIQCFPIDAVLRALDVKHIDYFSLDVEGLEVAILKTFPWGTVTVDVWTVEFRTFKDSKMHPGLTRERYDAIKEVFDATGLYENNGTLPAAVPGGIPSMGGLDVVYIRKDFV
ncbi:hypothetical protein CAPTEDRAFT_202512 [Capitella teleta]|uniref:Methyltransferase FkbM domain-containing protein n=1 Tax=Capitella teleta TaxID=283909 RepID=R7UBT6_CAPTE|nr:hypothetical protein CAPTEDRAFT_202512 [Capitella teleta]|eukprot:ELU01268.1 hypothetical protein CAPTEDRAFT_202512 [Capitella teleta]